MGNYNPNDTCVSGLEWFPSQDSVIWLDSDAKAVAMRLDAVTSDTIRDVWTTLCAVYSNDICLSLEIYDITSGPPPQPALSDTTYYPLSDIYSAPKPATPGSFGPWNGWNPSLGGAGPNWSALNSVTLTPYTWPISGQPVANDRFVFNFYGAGFDFAVQFAAVQYTQNGHWITRVRSRALVAQYWAIAQPGPITLRPYLWINGKKYWGASTAINTSNPTEIYADWYANPSNGLPWTPADIDKFDTGVGGGYGMGWAGDPTGSANNMFAILQGQLVIESAASDPRLRIASFCPPTKQGWRKFALLDSGTGVASDLTLVPGNSYLMVIRRTRGSDSVSVCRTAEPGVFLPGPPNWTSYTPQLDVNSRRITSLGDQLVDVLGAALRLPGGTISLDSQPYITTSDLQPGADGWVTLNEFFDNSPVNVDRDMQQDITPVTTGDYGWISVLVAMVASTTNDDLTINLRRRSDDVSVGAVTISSTDLITPRHSYQRIGKRIPGIAPTLTSGVQYYFDITSGADANQGWLVQVANSGYEPNPTGPPTGSYVANYGGDTDQIWIGNPLVATKEMDACINISTVPDPVSDFVAVASDQDCCISHIGLGWTVSSVPACGAFAYYEIQRLDHNSSTWHTIARVTDRLANVVNDYESIRNNIATYRARVVRSDGAPSDWSAEVTATATQLGCSGLIFTTNVDPTLTRFYQDAVGAREFSFPENVGKFMPIGQSFQVMYRELEDRGRTFKSTLRIRDGLTACAPTGCETPEGIGTDVFTPLRSIARAGLPYVCVHDEAGDRYFAYIQTPTGQWAQHGIEYEGGWAGYTLEIEVTEVTDVPYAIDSTVIGS